MKNFKFVSADSQAGVSSMIVLLCVVLLLFIIWEAAEFSKTFIESGDGNAAPALNPASTGCFGSQTRFDCYDQDEGTDFVDTSSPPERLLFGWHDDGQP